MIRCSSICVCLIGFGVNLFLIVTILFIKCLHAIFAIFLSDVTTVLSCVMFLGGALVQVLVNSLTVVQSLLTLLTSGLILVSLVLIVLLFSVSWLLLLLLVLLSGLCLFLMVSLLE